MQSRWSLACALFLALGTACSGGGEDGDTDDNGSDVDPDETVCDGVAFAELTRVELPDGGFPMLSDADHCSYTGNRSDRTYVLTDLTGDGQADLVVTADCTSANDVGETNWDVYPGEAGGFAQTATAWSLPSGGFPMAADADHCDYTGNRTDRTYGLVDMNGDARPDLVMTADCTRNTALGDGHWNVYLNEGDGFSASATRFDLPSGGFPMLSDADHCDYTGNRTDRTYGLVDFDGDDLPDLVVTGDCAGNSAIGTSRWNVYKNQGDGFATDATMVTLPPGGFPMLSDADHCSYTGNRSDRTYTLTDFDGDGLPDLVLTGDCTSNNQLGSSHWDVYRNTGDAFAETPTQASLPSGGFPMASDADHCSYTGNRTDRTYSLVDVNGDRQPELVVTADCTTNNQLGTTHWDVYTNDGTDFASEAVQLDLPEEGFPMLSDADHCSYTGNRTDRTYGFTDLTGDGLGDLVMTGDCTSSNQLGELRWNVYALECVN